MPPSSVPSLKARILAVAAITISGLSGGLVGYAVTDLQCENSCNSLSGSIALASAIFAAVGVSIVTNLALKAMAEWKTNEKQQSIRERYPVE
ncbi:MAG: hypothetical protein VYB07_04210 [Actinomycetota bacterium]|nr:hypothetical protein [Actinomycetota bacterium]